MVAKGPTSYYATLATVSSIASSLAIYLSGSALTNASTVAQAGCVCFACAAFLFQRVLFMAIVENVPEIDCIVANALSYGIGILSMRACVLLGLFLRARGVGMTESKSKMTLVHYLAWLGLAAGVASMGILLFQSITSEISFNCFQNLDQKLTASTNLLFAFGLSILTLAMSIPIMRMMRQMSDMGTTKWSPTYQRARKLSYAVKLVPLAVSIALIGLTISSIKNQFVFLCALIVSDLCAILLLVIPMLAVATTPAEQPGIRPTGGDGSNPIISPGGRGCGGAASAGIELQGKDAMESGAKGGQGKSVKGKTLNTLQDSGRMPIKGAVYYEGNVSVDEGEPVDVLGEHQDTSTHNGRDGYVDRHSLIGGFYDRLVASQCGSVADRQQGASMQLETAADDRATSHNVELLVMPNGTQTQHA
ncbi:hypothetical protein BC831DRAFT_448311 [Entophlyctis helioformis]|nr:hypothetical protein BC831DRAFT_448311 [Entophlyctis helioformis]